MELLDDNCFNENVFPKRDIAGESAIATFVWLFFKFKRKKRRKDLYDTNQVAQEKRDEEKTPTSKESVAERETKTVTKMKSVKKEKKS